MATQSVEFRAATGLTITAKLFSASSDTQVASVSATEATNRKGTYTAAFTDVAAGEYQLIAFDATPIPVASWWVTLTLTTATFGVYDKAGVVVMAANTLTASALAADAVTEIANAAGGTVNVSPLQATAPNRVAGTEIVTYITDASPIGPIAITDGDGDAVNLSSYTLKVCIERISDGTILANITPTVSGTSNNQITFTPTTDCVASTKPARWSLRSTTANEVLGYGLFTVESAARLS